MRNLSKNKEGFTLIELLVVMAIISILSSVVLSSVNTARLKSKDSAIKEELTQIANTMALDYNDYGSYGNLQTNQWSPTTNCNSFTFSGTYAPSLLSICTNLVSLSGLSSGNGFFSGNSVDNSKNFSFMIYLPYQSSVNGVATYGCVGSGGKSFTDTGSWTASGCYANP